MSFKLKVLLTNIILMAVSLGIIGFLLIHNSFSVSLDMQVESGMEEHQMVVSAVQAEVVDLLVNDNFTSMNQLSSMGEEIADTVEGTGTSFSLLDGEKSIIYTNVEGLEYKDDLLDFLEKGRRNYVIEEREEREILTIASVIQVNDSVLYVINQKDISGIYQENEKQIRFFQIIMLIALVVCCCMIFAITRWLTKPIEQLNNTAAVITSGDYSIRTEVVTNDEIGELAEKFDTMAEAIEEHVRELKNQARQQEDFVASFTHEIKTPMTAIIGYADMLRSKDMEEEQKILTANYIFHEGKRLEGMSLKLFDLIALGRKDIEMQDIYTIAFGGEIEEIATPILSQNNIRFRYELEPAILHGDRDLLKTVFVNLIDNARKASEEGSLVEMKGFWNQEDTYEIQLIDYGCGIPEEEVHKICEAFYMIDKSRARKQGGAGLGLATTLRIIEAHNGRLIVESVIQKGTTMRVLLPGYESEQSESELSEPEKMEPEQEQIAKGAAEDEA